MTTQSPIGPTNTYVHPSLPYAITDVEVKGQKYRGAAQLMEVFIGAIEEGKLLVGMEFYSDLELGEAKPIRFIRTLRTTKPDYSQAWEYRFDPTLNLLAQSVLDPEICKKPVPPEMAVSNPYEEVRLLNRDITAMQERNNLIIDLLDLPKTDFEGIIAKCRELWPGRLISLEGETVKVGSKTWEEAAKQEVQDIASISRDMNVRVQARPTKPFKEGQKFFEDRLFELMAISQNDSISPKDKAALCMKWMVESQAILDDPRCPGTPEEIAAMKQESGEIMLEIQHALNAMIAEENAKPPFFAGFPSVSSDVEPFFSIPHDQPLHEEYNYGTDLTLSTGMMLTCGEQVLVDWYLDLDPTNDVKLSFLEAHLTGEFLFQRQGDLGGVKYTRTEATYPVYCTDPIQLASGEFPPRSDDREEFAPGQPIDVVDPRAIPPVKELVEKGPFSWLVRLFSRLEL